MQLNLMCSSLSNELDMFFEILNNSMFDDSAPTASAFCTARRKIRHGAFIELINDLADSFYRNYNSEKWHGYRLVAVDGSQIRMPDSFACAVYFGQQTQNKKNSSPGKYTMSRIITFYDVLNSLTIKAELAPYNTQERYLSLKYISDFSTNDLLLFDRGFLSYTIFQSVMSAGSKFCMRLQRGSNMVEQFIASTEKEKIVYYKASSKHQQECKERSLPTEPVKLRLIKVELPDGNIEVLATNLYDSIRFPVGCFKKLYGLRWPIEENYKTLKVKAQLPNWTGETVETCKQDFYAKILTLNLTALFIFEERENVKKKTETRKLEYKVCWSEAIRKVRCRIVKLFCCDFIIETIHYLKLKLEKALTPIRPDRSYKRKTKAVRKRFHMRYKNIS